MPGRKKFMSSWLKSQRNYKAKRRAAYAKKFNPAAVRKQRQAVRDFEKKIYKKLPWVLYKKVKSYI